MSLYVKYLVCYDISNTRTRSKFFDFLKDLGLTPIQKSVFFGDLKTPEVRSLKAAAEKWLWSCTRRGGYSGERQKFCVHGIIGARQTGASNEHEHQTQFS